MLFVENTIFANEDKKKLFTIVQLLLGYNYFVTVALNSFLLSSNKNKKKTTITKHKNRTKPTHKIQTKTSIIN